MMMVIARSSTEPSSRDIPIRHYSVTRLAGCVAAFGMGWPSSCFYGLFCCGATREYC